MSSLAMTGTVEEAFERLERLAATQDKEVWAAQAAYRLLRRVLECWPQQQMVPFFCPRNGDIVIDDDEHCVSIRVSPASVALVTLDWTTGTTASSTRLLAGRLCVGSCPTGCGSSTSPKRSTRGTPRTARHEIRPAQTLPEPLRGVRMCDVSAGWRPAVLFGYVSRSAASVDIRAVRDDQVAVSVTSDSGHSI